jgi:hypothetical protein
MQCMHLGFRRTRRERNELDMEREVLGRLYFLRKIRGCKVERESTELLQFSIPFLGECRFQKYKCCGLQCCRTGSRTVGTVTFCRSGTGTVNLITDLGGTGTVIKRESEKFSQTQYGIVNLISFI